MDNLMKVLESTGLPAQRGVYTGRDKPDAYFTFLRIHKGAAVSADDAGKGSKELYRVTLICKGDFERHLAKALKVMRQEEYYINSVDAESYEADTGYWIVPITIEILKE